MTLHTEHETTSPRIGTWTVVLRLVCCLNFPDSGAQDRSAPLRFQHVDCFLLLHLQYDGSTPIMVQRYTIFLIISTFRPKKCWLGSVKGRLPCRWAWRFGTLESVGSDWSRGVWTCVYLCSGRTWCRRIYATPGFRPYKSIDGYLLDQGGWVWDVQLICERSSWRIKMLKNWRVIVFIL